MKDADGKPPFKRDKKACTSNRHSFDLVIRRSQFHWVNLRSRKWVRNYLRRKYRLRPLLISKGEGLTRNQYQVNQVLLAVL